MKRSILTIAVLLVIAFSFTSVFAQYRSQPTKPNISSILSTPSSGLPFAGFLNPEKFQIHHSFSMSFGNAWGRSLMLSSYMNTIDYRFSDKLWLRANLGIVSSPYNTFGEGFYLNKPQFFGGAQLHYQISENTRLMLQIDTSPYLYAPTFGQFSGFGY